MSVALRKRKLQSGRLQLYLDIYRYGERKTEALQMFLDGDRFHNRETLRMAELIRAKRELELQGHIHGLSGRYNRRSNLIAYMKTLGERKASEKTRELWVTARLRLEGFAGSGVMFGEITREFVENYKKYLLDKVMQSTASTYLAKFKCALKHAVRDNIIASDPSTGVSIRMLESIPVYLTLEEIKKFASVKCRKVESKNAFLFGCFTGLRLSDIRNLQWGDVENGHIVFRQKKTGNPERMPLSTQAKMILEAQKEFSECDNVMIFHLPHGNSLNKGLRRWAKKVGIEKRLSFHKSRHTFATMALSSGVDLYTTSKLLGHRDFKTTQIYAKVVDEKKQQAVDMLPMI